MNAFQIDDLRRTSWIRDTTIGMNTFHYPFKYKVKSADNLSEYYIVLRLAEQYLIRAEARNNLGDNTGAVSDLNTIRARAGLANSTAATKEDISTALQYERRIELFAEWGHRWFDLNR